MPRLGKAKLARHRAWLSDWRSPADMAGYVSAVNDVMGSADFFPSSAKAESNFSVMPGSPQNSGGIGNAHPSGLFTRARSGRTLKHGAAA
jgi:hypothetical protein